jgi:hypothetical protein
LVGVQVLELKDSDDSVWEMLGSNIVGVAANAISVADITSEYLQSLVRAPILTTMSTDGNFVAVAWPLYDDEDDGNATNIGLVEVCRHVKESLSWERAGNSLFGKSSGDFFGSSLSLLENGSNLAVGAAGNGGHAEVCFLNLGFSQFGFLVTSGRDCS